MRLRQGAEHAPPLQAELNMREQQQRAENGTKQIEDRTCRKNVQNLSDRPALFARAHDDKLLLLVQKRCVAKEQNGEQHDPQAVIELCQQKRHQPDGAIDIVLLAKHADAGRKIEGGKHNKQDENHPYAHALAPFAELIGHTAQASHDKTPFLHSI